MTTTINENKSVDKLGENDVIGRYKKRHQFRRK
jgi:hypothetical protein